MDFVVVSASFVPFYSLSDNIITLYLSEGKVAMLCYAMLFYSMLCLPPTSLLVEKKWWSSQPQRCRCTRGLHWPALHYCTAQIIEAEWSLAGWQTDYWQHVKTNVRWAGAWPGFANLHVKIVFIFSQFSYLQVQNINLRVLRSGLHKKYFQWRHQRSAC